MKFLRIEGVLKNETPWTIQKGRDCEDYPKGRHLRGAIGYIAKDMKLKISEIFPDIENDTLITRDAFPLCKKENWKPFQKSAFYTPALVNGSFVYRCASCSDRFEPRKYKTLKFQTKVNREKGCVESFFTYWIFHKPFHFRLSLLLNLQKGEKYIEDLFALVFFIKENGIVIGRRHQKGMGKFILLNWEHRIFEDCGEYPAHAQFFLNSISDSVLTNGKEILEFNFKKVLENEIRKHAKEMNISVDAELIEEKYTPVRPVDLSLLNYIEEQRNLRKLNLKVLPGGFRVRFGIKNPGNFYKVLKSIEEVSAIGKYKHLGFGEIKISF